MTNKRGLAMEKTDFKKALKQLYAPSARDFTVVNVPEMQFLMIDGHGNPNTAKKYKEAVEALFGVAYKIKFASKQKLEKDYTVPPLEGLWWADDMDTFTVNQDKDAWDWTMMIMQPEWITPELFENAVADVQKKTGLTGLEAIRMERYTEGLSVQILHIGSYDDEAPVLHKMHHQYIPDNGYTMNGKHHEVYLSDPRRVSPDKLKTVLRQPVAKG